MTERILKKPLRQTKGFLSNYYIQNRLFLSSVILICIIIISLYYLSFLIVSNLIIQRQADYELDSFKQVNNFFRSIFSSTEGYIETLYKSPNFKDFLTENYDKNDSITTMKYLSSFENNINTVLINKDFMDTVIILGKNNFACVYRQNNNMFETTDLPGDFNFSSFLDKSSLSPYLDNSNYPFYYQTINNSDSQYSNEIQIQRIINNKIIMVKLLRNQNGIADGIVIIAFKDNIVESIMPNSPYDRALYLTDNKGTVVWTNNSANTLKHEQASNFLISDSKESYRKNINGQDYLITFNILDPYDFKITSMTPVKSFIKAHTVIQIYIFIFGLCCILLAFISSYFFSKNVCKQLENLTKQLNTSTSTLPEKVSIINGVHFYSKLSLRTKIYFHFAVSIILPTMLFISCITYFNYYIYKDKIIELTNSSVKQLKWNIDYKIKNYNKLSVQAIFSNNIQKAFDEKEYNNNYYAMKFKISEDFLITKIKNKDIVSMVLYNTNGKNIYSNISFDIFPVTNISENFFNLMKKSSDNLVYLGASKDYLGSGPVILFARNIRSTGAGFGGLLGYMVFSVDQEAIYNITREVSLGTSALYFLVDESGNIIPNNLKSPALKVLNNNLNLKDLMTKNDGFMILIQNYKKYLVFYNTLDIPSLKVVSVIPLDEIISKVYPFIWYSMIILAVYLFIIIIITVFISHGITKPLKKLEELMNEIKNENFNIHMEYKGKDEIAILSENFNLMVDRLNQLIHENYQTKIHESELMFLEKEAQLNALQQQINPHFLYNTLESIKWMAYKIDALDICNMATALGKFFRGAITTSKDFITIQQEIEHLKNYIYIQKIRYQGKLDVVLQISDEITGYKTIKLILQPVVENAIIHGIEKMKSGGLITIRGYKLEQSIYFEIEDNGVGMDFSTLSKLKEEILFSANSEHKKAHVGLNNVYKRLKLYFGEKSTFEFLSEEGKGTLVKICIPVISNKKRMG